MTTTTPPPDKQPAAETLDGAGVVNRWRGMNVKISRYLYQSPAAVAQLCEMIDEALRNERERCAKVADRWANARSCTMHDDDPCCHVRTGARIAEVVREGK